MVVGGGGRGKKRYMFFFNYYFIIFFNFLFLVSQFLSGQVGTIATLIVLPVDLRQWGTEEAKIIMVDGVGGTPNLSESGWTTPPPSFCSSGGGHTSNFRDFQEKSFHDTWLQFKIKLSISPSNKLKMATSMTMDFLHTCIQFWGTSPTWSKCHVKIIPNAKTESIWWIEMSLQPSWDSVMFLGRLFYTNSAEKRFIPNTTFSIFYTLMLQMVEGIMLILK